MWGCTLGPCGRALMLFLRSWSHVSTRCGLSMFLHNKFKGGKKEFSHSLQCVESHLPLTFQGGWIWHVYSYFSSQP